MIEFDPAKDAANLAKHGVSLAAAADLDIRDDRKNYGEVRYRAWGLLDGLPHFLAYTMRGSAIRAISLHPIHQEDYDAQTS